MLNLSDFEKCTFLSSWPLGTSHVAPVLPPPLILWPYLDEISMSKLLGRKSNAARVFSSLSASDFLFHTMRTNYGHRRPMSFQGSSSTLSQMGPLTATCSNCYSYLVHWIYSSLHLCPHFICSEATYHGRLPFLSSQKVLENTTLDSA